MKVENNDEQWNDIPGYEGLYEASTLGKIRTKEGKATYTKKHGVRHWESRVLKGRGENLTPGYRVSLWKNGEAKDWLTARLIAITFIGVPESGMTVNHKDGNRHNNSLGNLEWLTRADNIRHGFEHGMYPQKMVILSSTDKTDVQAYRSMALAGMSIGRNHGYINNCIKKGSNAITLSGKEYIIQTA